MGRALRQASVMLLLGAAVGLAAAAVWAGVGDTAYRRTAGIGLMAVAGLLAVTGGAAVSRASTAQARAFLGWGPDREDPDSGDGLTAAGVFLLVSLPLLVAGLVVHG
ncbi:hypothetical protein [Blastococcus sp. SYSU D01042]